MKLTKLKRIFNFIFLAATAITLTACSGEQGSEFVDALVWAGNNTSLLTVTLVAAVPFIAMIPGIGIPVSAIISKVGLALIPVLKDVAEAVEQDNRHDRSVGEAAGTIVGRIADDPDSLVGKIPGTGLAANIAAAAVVRKVRRLKKKSGIRAFPNF